MVPSNEDDDSLLVPGSIERLAADWLGSEREVAAGIRNPAQSEDSARDLSARYDEAIRSATREELRLAWEAARRNQGAKDVGTEAWLQARRLSELLRSEYEAMPPVPADVDPDGTG
jgi:hypothetical protein